MANDGLSEPPRHADSKNPIFLLSRNLGPDHLRGPGVVSVGCWGVLSNESFFFRRGGGVEAEGCIGAPPPPELKACLPRCCQTQICRHKFRITHLNLLESASPPLHFRGLEMARDYWGISNVWEFQETVPTSDPHQSPPTALGPCSPTKTHASIHWPDLRDEKMAALFVLQFCVVVCLRYCVLCRLTVM